MELILMMGRTNLISQALLVCRRVSQDSPGASNFDEAK